MLTDVLQGGLSLTFLMAVANFKWQTKYNCQLNCKKKIGSFSEGSFYKKHCNFVDID